MEELQGRPQQGWLSKNIVVQALFLSSHYELAVHRRGIEAKPKAWDNSHRWLSMASLELLQACDLYRFKCLMLSSRTVEANPLMIALNAKTI
jgi:hypothetical protein